MMGLPGGQKIKIDLAVYTQYRRVTDAQTPHGGKDRDMQSVARVNKITTQSALR